MKRFKNIVTGQVVDLVEGESEIYYDLFDMLVSTQNNWTEIKKDYEVLSVYGLTSNRNVVYTVLDGNVLVHPSGIHYPQTDRSEYPIHSIKRNSDGEIFTVGDVINGYTYKNRKILAFVRNRVGGITITQCKGSSILADISKYVEPILVTEDGVEVFEGDHVYLVGENFKMLHFLVNDTIKYSVGKRFSTKEAAEEYILMNQKCLSLNDLLSVWGSSHSDECYKSSPMFKKFKELAASKL